VCESYKNRTQCSSSRCCCCRGRDEDEDEDEDEEGGEDEGAKETLGEREGEEREGVAEEEDDLRRKRCLIYMSDLYRDV
jgi:hypothetical protein